MSAIQGFQGRVNVVCNVQVAPGGYVNLGPPSQSAVTGLPTGYGYEYEDGDPRTMRPNAQAVDPYRHPGQRMRPADVEQQRQKNPYNHNYQMQHDTTELYGDPYPQVRGHSGGARRHNGEYYSHVTDNTPEDLQDFEMPSTNVSHTFEDAGQDPADVGPLAVQVDNLEYPMSIQRRESYEDGADKGLITMVPHPTHPDAQMIPVDTAGNPVRLGSSRLKRMRRADSLHDTEARKQRVMNSRQDGSAQTPRYVSRVQMNQPSSSLKELFSTSSSSPYAQEERNSRTGSGTPHSRNAGQKWDRRTKEYKEAVRLGLVLGSKSDKQEVDDNEPDIPGEFTKAVIFRHY